MILDVKHRMEQDKDNLPDCLVKTLLENREAENLDDEDLCMLAAVFTLGGVHSVCSFEEIWWSSAHLLFRRPDLSNGSSRSWPDTPLYSVPHRPN